MNNTIVFMCPKCNTVNTLAVDKNIGSKNHHCKCGKVLQVSWSNGNRVTQVH
jgi:transcription elongation factor Elf1